MNAPAPVNHVQLAGRVSADARTLSLPSGDTMVSFRLVVARDDAARRRSKQSVDTIECVAWSARLRRSAQKLRADEYIEVTGALRRRFSRGAGSVQSFASVEIETLVRRR